MSWKNLFNKKVRQMKSKKSESQNSGEEMQKMTSIHHLIVLDESGSMGCITQATISGCNETIQTIRMMQEQTSDTQQHYVSIYLFDTMKSRYIIKGERAESVHLITEKDYRPNASTPLYDALGFTLTELKQTLKEDKEAMGYVTIITDGEENASREYRLEVVKELIDDLKKKNVVFTFIGANIDAADYGRRFNIDNTMQFVQNDECTGAMWECERKARLRSNARFSFSKMILGDEISMAEFSKAENCGAYYEKKEVPADRITPETIITSLNENEIFVFGSNPQGAHNGGASAYALHYFGAISGQAEGLQGQSYAVPTDGVNINELYLGIRRFHDFAQAHPELTFYVTRIGCGTAGWSVFRVAPMFANCANLDNVKLPREFWEYL